jgi:hypothetical protein
MGNQHNTPNLNAASFCVTGKARRLNLHEGPLVDQLGAGFPTVRVWASGGTWVRTYFVHTLRGRLMHPRRRSSGT